MKWKSVLRPRLRLVTIAGALVIPAVVWAQAQTAQVIAVRAGRVFDPRSGTNVTNQVVLITGERISDAGPADRVQIPAGARVIDLSQATVLPGLIDGHLHLTDAAGGLQHQMMVALYSATQSLNAGFTTQVVMGSHGGGYADVELRKAIESRLVRGPRLLVAGPVLDITTPGNDTFPLDFKPFRPNIVANGPEAMRAAVRELAHYGVDHIKMTTTGPFVFKPNGDMVNQALPSLEELKAAVDEAHRRGLFVATHSYGGDGLKWALEAGVDDIQHAVAADDADIKMQDSVGTIEKGKYADLIAVAGDPLQDITEMQRVTFVMKGGEVVRNDVAARAMSSR